MASVLTVRTSCTVQKADHQLKHKARKAEIGGCVSIYTYISRIASDSEAALANQELRPKPSTHLKS